MGPAAMTVLCLVEQDAGEAADASLRALTFAARLAGAGPAGPVPVAAGRVGPAGPVPRRALAGRRPGRTGGGARRAGSAPLRSGPGWRRPAGAGHRDRRA